MTTDGEYVLSDLEGYENTYKGKLYQAVGGGVLVQELIDRDPIRGGHVGFSPYSTILKIRDIQVRKIAWEKRKQIYEPEF